MPFEVIDHVKLMKTGKNAGEPLSKFSVQTYKQLLNKLADSGFETKDILANNPKEVISWINTIYDSGSSEDKQQKRRYYSAIFYALDQYPDKKLKPYYDAFRKEKEYK